MNNATKFRDCTHATPWTPFGLATFFPVDRIYWVAAFHASVTNGVGKIFRCTDENPYLSLIHAGKHHMAAGARWISTVVVVFATISFWLGLFLTALGSVISFVPGSECRWFIVTGVLLSSGLLVPKRHYRIAAMILALLCFAYAYSGYVRGVEYRKWLDERDTVSQLRAASQNIPAESGMLR